MPFYYPCIHITTAAVLLPTRNSVFWQAQTASKVHYLETVSAPETWISSPWRWTCFPMVSIRNLIFPTYQQSAQVMKLTPEWKCMNVNHTPAIWYLPHFPVLIRMQFPKEWPGVRNTKLTNGPCHICPSIRKISDAPMTVTWSASTVSPAKAVSATF